MLITPLACCAVENFLAKLSTRGKNLITNWSLLKSSYGKSGSLFIASTPPWTRPEVWGHKREWIEEHFPYLKRKLILTHRKDLLIGDVLIDDTRFRGQPDFQGNWFWFNKDWSNRNWNACLEYIKTLEKDYEKV